MKIYMERLVNLLATDEIVKQFYSWVREVKNR